MPEVNLLKDTEKFPNGQAKPVVSRQPELTQPSTQTGQGFGGVFKSLFNRAPKPLPVAPPSTSLRPSGMNTMRTRTGERILSETKKAAPSVIPLPEDDDTTYNVNLLSEDLVTTVNPKQRGIVLGLIAFAAALAVGVGYAGLYVYQRNLKQDITTTTDQVKVADREIASLSTDQQTAASTAQKTTAIRSLIDRHTRWTKFFSLLERYTLPTVTYGSAFTGTLNGSVSLTATTTSYEEVAKQYLIYQQLVKDQKFISNFVITSATSQIDKDGVAHVTFVITLTLLPSNFTLSSEEVAALLKDVSTTTTTPTNSSTLP